MCDFSPTELNDRLHAITLFQESDGLFFLEVVVVIIRIRAELQFLHLDDVLLLLSFVLLLFLLVLPLTIIHGFRHGRFRSRSDENQIEAHVLGSSNSCRCRHDLGRSVREYSSDFSYTDCLIYVFSDPGPAGLEASWWVHYAGRTDALDSADGVKTDFKF